MTEIQMICELISRGASPAAAARVRRQDTRPRKTVRGTCLCGQPTGARGKTCGSEECRRVHRARHQWEKRAIRREEREAKYGPTRFGPKPKGATP